MEDTCGLGATGITGNTTLFQQFTRWANIWSKTGFNYAILAFDGHDIDDPNYTTAPTGTFTGATTRDYNLDGTYKMLKIKSVEITYDGTNYVKATPIDDRDQEYAVKDPNIDGNFDAGSPKYDLIANGFKIFPKFTAAQVSAGAKVYIEFFRSPREFSTTGTDSYEPGFDSQYHRLVSLGASYEYAKLYKPDLAQALRVDLYGGGTVKGMIKDLETWYSSKSPSNGRITVSQDSVR